jgi:hypothetical protein
MKMLNLVTATETEFNNWIDGVPRPRTLGEMTKEERRAVFTRACLKLKAEFEHPANQVAVTRFLNTPLSR